MKMQTLAENKVDTPNGASKIVMGGELRLF
jgi:hypothetical protein